MLLTTTTTTKYLLKAYYVLGILERLYKSHYYKREN